MLQLTSISLLSTITLTAYVHAAAIQKNLLRRAVSFEKPIMGYNTYNAFSCSPTETDAHNQISILQNNGYLEAGYNMFSIDCGWQGRTDERNSSAGNAITQNLQNFPSGMNALGQYIISRGFNYGLYTDAGYLACDPTVPSPVLGSLGYEDQDATQFASWGVSYLKYDNCYASGKSASDNAPKDPRTDFVSRFSPMTNALRSVGINGGLTCEWGVPYQNPAGIFQGPVSWTSNISTSFRVSDDISDDWDAVVRIINQEISIANSNLTGPGFHGDLDLLEVGNGGLSFAEQQTHFAYWAMAKSALMISTDLTKASFQTQNLLLNSGLIAINQDDFGTPIKLVQRYTGDNDQYAGRLSNGDLAVLLINMQNFTRSLTVNFYNLNITTANYVDLFTGATGNSATSYTSNTQGHGSIALRLSNTQEFKQFPSVNWISATSGNRAGNVNVLACTGCPNGQKVGYIGGGNGNTLTFNNVQVSTTSANILFDYINCEIGYGGQGQNVRTATVSVNGQTPVDVEFPISGYNWNADIATNYRVVLYGFNPGNSNTIQIGGSSYGPDLSRIGVIG